MQQQQPKHPAMSATTTTQASPAASGVPKTSPVAPVHSRPALPLENPLPPDMPAYGAGSKWSPGAAWMGAQPAGPNGNFEQPMAPGAIAPKLPGMIAPVAPVAPGTLEPVATAPVAPPQAPAPMTPVAQPLVEPKLPEAASAPVATEQPRPTTQPRLIPENDPSYVPSVTDPKYPFEVPPLPSPQPLQR